MQKSNKSIHEVERINLHIFLYDYLHWFLYEIQFCNKIKATGTIHFVSA